jgi:hypothetical protein
LFVFVDLNLERNYDWLVYGTNLVD